MPKRRKSLCQSASLMEYLEDRKLLSGALLSHLPVAVAKAQPPASAVSLPIGPKTSKAATANSTLLRDTAKPAATSPGSGSMTPAEMDSAYGVNQITFGNIQGNGAGETIAIVDAYDDPTAASDLHAFDQQFGLPDPPSFQKFNQSGMQGNYPPTDPAGAGNPNGTWEMEESLDIEWAHAIAPDANIDLVEANSPTDTNLIQDAVNVARNLPGVVAVSMSFSTPESSGESAYDTYFTTPSGHEGVTFLAATGDQGEPGGYPAYSPNVIAVGGTTLNQSNGTYENESAWSGSGGGISRYERQPAYQQGVVSQSSTARTIPDVSMEANPNTGVAVYDSYDDPSSPWVQVGGTSLATPMWAGLIAIADQGRALASLPSLDGATQTLPALYKLPSTDFHDITSGSNGYSAGTGYDLVSGRGSPVANLLVPALAGVESISGTVFQDNNGDGLYDTGDTPIAGATVYIDANNNGVLDSGEVSTTTNASGQYTLIVPTGGYTVRQVLPANEAQIAPAGTTASALTVPASTGSISGQNFADFPTVLSLSGNSQTAYIKLDSTGTFLQIFNAAAPGNSPAYQVALADLPSLTFNLGGTDDQVVIDYTSGNPAPFAGLSIIGIAGSGDGLQIVGAGASQTLQMTDSQIGPANGPAVSFQNLDNFAVQNVTVDDTGDFANFLNLTIDNGADFVLM